MSLERLAEKSKSFKESLIDDLIKQLKKMPADVKEGYFSDGKWDLDKIFIKANNGQSIYWTSGTVDNYRWKAHSSLQQPKLHLIIKKINLVEKIEVCLSSEVDLEQKLTQIANLWTNENQLELLKKQKKINFFGSNKGEKFVESIRKILVDYPMPTPIYPC